MRSCSVYVGLHPVFIALKLTLIFHPPVVPQTLAAYLSLCPSTQDVVLDFSRVDTLTFPLPHDPPPSSLYQTLPHPAQRSSDVKRSLGQIASCNGHVSRDQVRYFNPQRDCLRTSDNSVAPLSFSKIKASYANSSWPVFSQMVNPVVPLGGSLGYDDKLFSFVWCVHYSIRFFAPSFHFEFVRLISGHSRTSIRMDLPKGRLGSRRECLPLNSKTCAPTLGALFMRLSALLHNAD